MIPSYISWANDFDSLLSDGIGVELFWSYLEEESLGHLLKFWLAVEGLKKESDPGIIGKYIKCISKNFFRTSLIELDPEIAEEISEELQSQPSKTRGNSTIFNRAQDAIKENMRSGPYLNFLKSETYLNYLQSQLNDQIQQDKEKTDNKERGKDELDYFPPEGAEDGIFCTSQEKHEWKQQQQGLETTTTTTTKISGHPLPTVPEEESILHVSSSSANHTSEPRFRLFNPSKSNKYPEEFHSYHALGSTYNPVSRIDSEIQSISSGAYTTTDDNYSSFTATDPENHRKKKRKGKTHHHPSRIITEPSSALIPRPFRSGSLPPRPLSPKSFAQVLTEKLQNYIDQKKHEKKTFEILNNKLNHIDSTNTPPPLLPPEGFESDQSILDEHVSRIWKDKTPIHVRSPRPRSPKWNRTLPNKKSNGYYDPSLSFADDPFSSKSSSIHIVHGQERIMDWVNKAACSSSCDVVYSDEDVLRSSARSSSKSTSFSRSLNKQHPIHHSSTMPPWNTAQQLQEVNRRLLLTTTTLSTNPSSITIPGPPDIPGNASLIKKKSSNSSSSSVTYTFSNEPEGMPYRVKIQGIHSSPSKITLFQVKSNLPKQGRYRFYFKTRVDGEPCFEEEREDSAFVPLWSEGKIIVQCRDDVV